MRPLRIDVHTHVLPKTWPDLKARYGYGGFVQLDHSCEGEHAMMRKDDGQNFRKVEPNVWDVGERLAYMDSVQCDVQVLSIVPVMFSYWAKAEDCADLCVMLNDDVADKVQQSPQRFVGLGTLPMQDPALAVRELERCVKDLKLAGVQIGSHIDTAQGKVLLSDAQLRPVFEKAEELGAAIFVHPWDMMGQDMMAKYWLPWLVGMPAETSLAICSLIFSNTLVDLPNLRVCFAHAGGSFPATVGRVQHGFDCRPDLCAVDTKVGPRQQLGRFWVDSLAHDDDAFRLVMKVVGEDRVCMGSDYPFPLGECYPLKYPGELIDKLDVDDKVKKKLLEDNALEWLGVPRERFVRAGPNAE